MNFLTLFKNGFKFVFISYLLASSTNVLAATASVYKATYTDFIDAYISKGVEPKYLWLTGEKKTESSRILGHKYAKIRVPYWYDSKTATSLWILEEIGKEKPITIGIVIKEQKVQVVRILKFRESRGWEVELPAFTQQFEGVGYQAGGLTTHIDGISGATLSVRAVKAVTAMALMLNKYVVK